MLTGKLRNTHTICDARSKITAHSTSARSSLRHLAHPTVQITFNVHFNMMALLGECQRGPSFVGGKLHATVNRYAEVYG